MKPKIVFSGAHRNGFCRENRPVKVDLRRGHRNLQILSQRVAQQKNAQTNDADLGHYLRQDHAGRYGIAHKMAFVKERILGKGIAAFRAFFIHCVQHINEPERLLVR